MSNYYKKNDNIVARKIHDTYFLIDITDNYVHDTCVLYQINEVGFFIWNYINEKETSDELAIRLKNAIKDNIDYQIIRNDVNEFFCQLKIKGFIKESKSSKPREIKR